MARKYFGGLMVCVILIILLFMGEYEKTGVSVQLVKMTVYPNDDDEQNYADNSNSDYNEMY